MRFDTENCSEIGELYLHDAELGLVTVEYKDQSAVAVLTYPGHYAAKLRFTNVKHIGVPINEPWGGGFYVYTVEAKALYDGDFFETSVVLNSGDTVTVISAELSIEGYDDPRPRLPK